MNEKKEKKTTLTLKTGTLSLSKSTESSKVQQHLAHGRTKTVTVVEKKHKNVKLVNKEKLQSEISSQNLSDEYTDDLAGSLTKSERSARLDALKRAAKQQEEKIVEQQRKIQEEVVKLEQEDVKEENTIQQEPEKIIDNNQDPKEEEKVDVKKIPDKKHNTTFKHGTKQVEDADEILGEKNSKKANKVEIKTNRSRWDEKRKVSVAMLATTNADEDVGDFRVRSIASIKRAREKAKRLEATKLKSVEKIIRDVIIPDVISVQELSVRMAEKSSDVIRELMKLGVMAGINHHVDGDTAELIAQTFGHKVKRVADSDVENVLIEEQDDERNLLPRPPVVTIMGHVDHGKTSLLDAIRATDVAAGEAGGITQHIGAYSIKMANGESITFLDTPGHEAFTAMRARGAKSTDIVVLVVAADDGIMAQTIEAINHAKAAEVPIIVAINKIDKADANPNKVRNELLNHGLVAEEMGGDIIIVEVSAKNKLNLDKLEEAILLQAEMLNLRANPNRSASGTVIESKIDKGKGIVATLLVQNGSLNNGDIVVAGSGFGKVKVMHDDKGLIVSKALPSMPIEILGLSAAPEAGDIFSVVGSEKQARDITEFRLAKFKNVKTTSSRMTVDELFSYSVGGVTKTKELHVIIKADVHGSIEAISSSITRLSNEEVKVKILHSAVGGISESDISLARASKAIILGFNVRASTQAKSLADKNGVEMRYYSIIYNLIDDVRSLLSGMLSPILREEYLGNVEIRQVFNITKVGKVAGSFVTAGIVKKGARVRLLRDNIVIHEGKLKTLRRFKDEVKEVRENYECGIAFENYDDIREKDVVEVYEIIEEQKTL